MGDWIEVEDYKQVPVGEWLVKVEKLEFIDNVRTCTGYRHHIMISHKNCSTIGHHFAFDENRVVAYKDVGLND